MARDITKDVTKELTFKVSKRLAQNGDEGGWDELVVKGGSLDAEDDLDD